jgi:hypothetical protein
MIDGGVPSGRETWPADVLESLRVWEQGDVVTAPPFFYFADPARPVWAATVAAAEMTSEPHVVVLDEETSPPYGLITTQSCDICEEDSKKPCRPWVQVAPIYDGRSWAKKMREGRGPLFLLHIPGLGDDRFWVADLRLEFPIEKGWLASQERLPGFTCEHRPNPAARAGRKRWRGSQKLLADGSLVHSPGWLVVRAGSSS